MNRANPERVYAAIATILERKHSVKIEYKLLPKTKNQKGVAYEQNCN